MNKFVILLDENTHEDKIAKLHEFMFNNNIYFQVGLSLNQVEKLLHDIEDEIYESSWESSSQYC